MSDNALSAENQQERLIKIGWITGFVDGEGCFSICFVRQPDRLGRRGYKTGWQVAHRFVVTQGVSSLSCLEELKDFFGVGRMLVNKRHDNHKEHLAQYIVDTRAWLTGTIIAFFREYPLRSSKQRDFERFVQCMDIVERGEHLTPEGLIKIAKTTEQMNHKKSRRDMIRILRGHTPNIPTLG